MDLPTKPAKRKRLNFACNHCRARKTRCDEQRPSCHACIIAGIPCVTTDKRRPGVDVERKSAGAGATIRSTTAQAPLLPKATERRQSIGTAHVQSTRSDPLTPMSCDGQARETQGAVGIETGTSEQAVRFSGRLPSVPRIRGSNTLELLTGWLDLAFGRLGLSQSFSLESIDTTPFSLSISLPTLPPTEQCQQLISNYFATANVIFPVLDRQDIEDALRRASQTEITKAEELPSFLILCMVLVLGSMDHAEHARDLIHTYINFCKTMLGHAVSWGSIESVKFIFLLALSLRWQDQISSSWPLIEMCVSMAQLLGINRRSSLHRRGFSSPSDEQGQGQDHIRRTWWSIYSFEKLFAFELGKPSTISDLECDQLEPAQATPSSGPNNGDQDPDFSKIVISLARVLSQIDQRNLKARHQEELSEGHRLEHAIKEKVLAIGEGVLLLMKWADSLPEGLRPRSDLLCSSAKFPLAAFVSMQYNNALLMMTRNSFLISEDAFKQAVDIFVDGQPCNHVIRGGPTIAANAARSIVKLIIDGADRGNMKPIFYTLTAPLQALYVLVVHLITHPGSRLASSDMNLLHNAAEFAQAQYEKFNTDSKLLSILRVLEQQLNQHVPAHASTFGHYGSPGSSLGATMIDPTPPVSIPSGLDSTFLGMTMEGSLTDEISWDWGDLSAVFNAPFEGMPA